MEVKLQPKFGRVLIKREIKEKTAGGIIIPDAKRHANCEGVIQAMGETAGWVEVYEDGQLVPKKIFDVGDKVMFGRYAGTWIDGTLSKDGKDNDDGTLFMCSDADILAVMR